MLKVYSFYVEHQKSTEPELHSIATPATKMMRILEAGAPQRGIWFYFLIFVILFAFFNANLQRKNLTFVD
jgi:hypothetical protein